MNMDSTAIAAAEIPPGYEILRNDMGFSEHIGPFYVRKPKDGYTLAFGFRALAHHANRGGVVHGGMLVSFRTRHQGPGVRRWQIARRR
ncbi:MAG: hypothetical protein K0S54_3235 [Alphaproteobacteria bacterium]|nr:hypothetical protein [Alphaproteobacteria bacterium]